MEAEAISERKEDVVDLGKLADEVFDAVIFDMDGTLIDSTPAVIRAWTIWAAEHGLTSEDLQGHHGVPSAGVVRSLLPEERHEAAIERINELEINDVGDIVVLPGAAEALASLARGKSAIATSCTVLLADARIAAAELVPPSVLVTVDHVERGKPHPDPFLEAARQLGVDPTRCLVVEDAPKGLLAAHAAGCFTLAVTTTTPVDQLIADAVIPNLASVRFESVGDGIRVVPAED
jgi:sugar-phosphatase